MIADQKVLLNKFLAIEGDSPEHIKAKLLLLRDQVRNPEKFATDNHPEAVKKFRRNARQSIRRILARHPEIAERVMKEAA